MAKKSTVVRNEKRKKLVDRYKKTRMELKEILRKPTTSPEERERAFIRLCKLPRDTAKGRVRNRCALTGRPRGYYRKFGLGRSKLRERALAGELPGVHKSSW